jgi:hypothetical protein
MINLYDLIKDGNLFRRMEVNELLYFEDQAARKAFWNSKFVRVIPARYGVIAETPGAEQYDMVIVLNDEFVEWGHDGINNCVAGVNQTEENAL